MNQPKSYCPKNQQVNETSYARKYIYQSLNQQMNNLFRSTAHQWNIYKININNWTSK